MSLIYQYTNSSYGTINKILYDADYSYIWMASAKKNNVCHLLATQLRDLSQIVYDIEIEADSIDNILLYTSNYDILLASYSNHDDYIATKYKKNSIYTSYVDCLKPEGIEENILSVVVDTNIDYLYFLTPGIISGTNAKLYEYSAQYSYTTCDDIIDLPDVYNCVDMTIDTDDNIWIVTGDNPANLVRVYFESGGWKHTITTLE